MLCHKGKKAGRDDRQQTIRIFYIFKKVLLQIFQKLQILFFLTLLLRIISWHTPEFLFKQF